MENLCWEDIYHVFVDSDSDNFQTLKKASKPKQNGTAKQTKSDAASGGAKESLKSPVRPTSTQGKTAVKSPVTPKTAPPPQPKQTPTSVLDYFGSTAIQRSDKKLVASTKRKAVSTEGFLPVFTLLVSCFSSFFKQVSKMVLRTNWLKLIFSSADSGHRWSEWRANCQSAADGWGDGGRLFVLCNSDYLLYICCTLLDKTCSFVHSVGPYEIVMAIFYF